MLLYLILNVIVGVCILATADMSFYNNYPCSNDTNCPQTAVCGASGKCISPYVSSHSCGGQLFCGPTAECQNGKCVALYNIGDKCGKCSEYLLYSSIVFLLLSLP